MKYAVNISIAAGVDFSQEFTMTNPDMTPVNITGYKFVAKLAKHPSSVDAVTSTRDVRKQKYISFICNVIDGQRGVYNLYLPAKSSQAIPEGKYVYNVVAKDVNGVSSEAVGGLAFVEQSFAMSDGDYLFDGGSSVDDGNTIILNGGTASGFW